MNEITLKEFIVKIGDEESAKIFKVKERTAKSWRLGERIPRLKMAQRIVKVTQNNPIGCVVYEGIYG